MQTSRTIRLFGRIIGTSYRTLTANAPVSSTDLVTETNTTIPTLPLIVSEPEAHPNLTLCTATTTSHNLTDEVFSSVPPHTVKQEPELNPTSPAKLEEAADRRKRDREEEEDIEVLKEPELAEPQPKKNRKTYGSSCDYWDHSRKITIKHYVQAMEDVYYRPRQSIPTKFYRPLK